MPRDGSDAPWDDGDDLGDQEDESVLDALDEYVPVQDADDPWDLPEPPTGDGDDQIETLLVTATNPAGTVVATALMSGQVVRVELSSQVTKMTESQLAEEITVISTLAREQARAAQYAFIATFMHQLGHDPAGTRGFLEHEIGLPSPQTVLDEKARLFATRYADENR